ncbi:hypothetical protein O7626_05000 [Micromonospora sp. WMMD1102]|nr:hypothetical protein [Micromonospora sp. WMMD1102]MDG4785294.1 hypothetical protein [Micromonospora sp. WMMD1102]
MITVVDQFGQVIATIDEAAILPEGGGDGTGGVGLLEGLLVVGLALLAL